MEEPSDHILPKPETMPEPIPAVAEAEPVSEVISEHTATEASAERSAPSVAPEATPELAQTPSEAETTASEETETSVEQTAPVEAETVPEVELAPSGAETTAGQTVSFEAKAASKHLRAHPELEVLLERVPGYLSVKEAASIMGVSERSVYGYIGAGKLPGARIGNIVVVVEEYVETYERKGPGRTRTAAPFWRMPSLRNLEFLTTIVARIRPGQGELLEQRLYEIRTSKKHHLLGTAARYVARNRHDPNEIEIVLIWRNSIMPSLVERESALAAFYDDLADIVDWETVSRKDGRVLLHA